MPLSKREYDKMMADPKRSEAARRAAATRERNYKRRREAIHALMVVHHGWPSEDAIEEWLVDRYGKDWRKGR